ncbi:hypothetical protein [Nannocystis punicea]|uniref:Uncharacterized protein n=1 Tax=Nannocystis punicea TaxID=2995304 RepID=A0ABY7HBQ9_9BACT|nr:hypothetical protein [Nannocystis poenicansa]WAS96543.1 hypothetical protein O0S08_10330 [Nannocystis poenicansa]
MRSTADRRARAALSRSLLALAVAFACRPGERAAQPTSRAVETLLATPLPTPVEATAPAPEPALTLQRPPSRPLAETLLAGPLVEAAPVDPCPPPRPCTTERVPASFRVRVRLDGGGRESAPVLARVEQRTEALESCLNASLRRDRCIRSGVALLYRLHASGAPEWIAVDGAADDRALECVDRELRGLDLRRFVRPEAGLVELRVVALYQPAHRAYYRADGVGLALSRAADDPPCPPQ